MDSQLETVNKQITQENERHSRAINDLKNRTLRENEQHQRTIANLKAQKDRIKNIKKQNNESLENLKKLFSEYLMLNSVLIII